MKYMVYFQEDTKLSTQYPAERCIELVEQTASYLGAKKNKDQIVDWGFTGIRSGLYALLEVKNHAELYEICESVPFRALSRVDYTPLLTGAEFGDIINGVRKHMVDNFHTPMFTPAAKKSA